MVQSRLKYHGLQIEFADTTSCSNPSNYIIYISHRQVKYYHKEKGHFIATNWSLDTSTALRIPSLVFPPGNSA